MVTSDVILGCQFLQRNGCTVEMGPTDQLCFTKDKSVVPLGSVAAKMAVSLVADMALMIPHHTDVEVLLKNSIISNLAVITWFWSQWQENNQWKWPGHS